MLPEPRATQAAAPPPHLALTGANPSPPGQTQEQTPVTTHMQRWEKKPQLKPGSRVAKEEDPRPPTSWTGCRLNPHNQLGRLCVCGICKRSLRAPTKRTHRSRTRLESELPHSRSRDQHSVGGSPRDVSWTVTPSEGNDSHSSDSRKAFIILMF